MPRTDPIGEDPEDGLPPQPTNIPELFPGGMTRTALTYQLSDHLPLWMQVKTDVDGYLLDAILQR